MPDALAPLPEAVVAVVRREDQVLIIRRAAHVQGGGYWAPPSGKIEPGETQAAAVAREVGEETGLLVRPVEKVWECLSSDGTFLLHWWVAEYISGELVPDPTEVSEVQWLTVAQFTALEQVFHADLEFFRTVLPSL